MAGTSSPAEDVVEDRASGVPDDPAPRRRTASRAVAAPVGAVTDPVNEVRLRGRLSAPPTEKVLPSGDVLWTFRVVVPRSDQARRRSRAAVDALDCAAWTARARRSVSSWSSGDEVEVRGTLHRRFYRTGAGVASRVDVEVESCRLIRRAGS